MTAEWKPRGEIETRIPLQDVIPLSTPLVLQIEPTNKCNLRCWFCPVNNDTTIDRGQIKIKTYTKIIEDLKDFDKKIKCLHLYGNGEPLLNRALPDLIHIAKQSGCIDSVDTTTNGILLTNDYVDELIEAGLDKISISVNGLSDHQYYKNCHANVDFEQFFNRLEYLYSHRKNCKVYIKSINELYTVEMRKEFVDLFSPISDCIYLENLTNPWSDFPINASGKGAFSDTIVNKLVCPSIFYTMVINWDGTISLCCTDWKNQLIIGDANVQSLNNIWRSAALYSYQVIHLAGKRSELSVCNGCNQINQCTNDNIDEYRNQILRRM
jgi:sulfatase maturation enzyme AslB (radical SAM superfamily)